MFQYCFFIHIRGMCNEIADGLKKYKVQSNDTGVVKLPNYDTSTSNDQSMTMKDERSLTQIPFFMSTPTTNVEHCVWLLLIRD